jgi:hypothetical protein
MTRLSLGMIFINRIYTRLPGTEKTIIMKPIVRTTTLWVLATLLSIVSFAQDKKVDVDVNLNKDGGSTWYTQPWVWIVGAAVFILLIVALTRGNNRAAE